jgi:hypothetical protein
MDIKEFNKQVKKGCHLMAPPPQRKECMKTMMCNWEHCEKEQQDLASAALTDADRESCKNKDFIKQFNCEQKLTEKKGLFDKDAALKHCTANKCPQIRNLIKKASLEFAKGMMNFKKNSILAQREECMKNHCSNEVLERDKQFDLVDKGVYECEKKFATHKEQIKCNRKQNMQENKANLKADDCRKNIVKCNLAIAIKRILPRVIKMVKIIRKQRKINLAFGIYWLELLDV